MPVLIFWLFVRVKKKKLNKNLATKTKGSGNRKNSSLSKNHSAPQGHDTKGSDFRSAT
jgi:hypothetical protein